MATATTERQMWRDLVAQFHTGMLITRAPHGAMHARPMAVAKLEDDDDILFATSIASGKVTDIDDDHQAAVTFQSSTAYVSISGPAKVVTDRSKIEAVWSEPMRVWFPAGPTDPSLCLLQLRPVQCEFWNMQGAKGLRYVFEAAKAYVQGRQPITVPDLHGEVDGPRSR
jgi:general stress protein 26